MGSISQNNQAANQAILSSGALSQHEEIINNFKGTLRYDNESYSGYAFITDKRFIFGNRPRGWSSKGTDLVFECSLGAILSVTTSGVWDKKTNLSFKQNSQPCKCELFCQDNEICAAKIIEAKMAFKEREIIEAKTIIIEEAKKDKASEIIQKRLARGEIDLDEFHRLIQRS